jgi:hypothetical protein
MLVPMHAKGDVGRLLRRAALVGAFALVKAMGARLGEKLADVIWPEDEEGDEDGDESQD